MLIEGSAVEKVHGVGSTVVGVVPGTFAQSVASSHNVAAVPGMAEQRPELVDGTPVTAAVRHGDLTPPDSPLHGGVVGI